jgi:hypothetical protein
MNPRGPAALAALCGAVVLAGWGTVGHFGSHRVEDSAPPVVSAQARTVAGRTESIPAPQVVTREEAPHAVAAEGAPQAVASEAAPAPANEDAVAVDEQAIAELAPPARETPGAQLTSLGTPAPVPSDAKPATLGTADDCAAIDSCVDHYLWALYQRTPKLDTIKVSEKVKVTVTTKGKTRTVSKTVAKLVDEDFGWKDPKAALRAGMPLMDYVIGGMDRHFKLRLYRALRAMDEAGLEPGITSGFRDDYRQSIASGKKAASNRSYHGGSLRGGYGHGLAADLVSVKGETRDQRWISSEALWKWVDAHGAEFGVGRPYLDRDPPHVGPIDGQEYADKRGRREAKKPGLETRRATSAVSNDHRRTKSARTASPKARSI